MNGKNVYVIAALLALSAIALFFLNHIEPAQFLLFTAFVLIVVFCRVEKRRERKGKEEKAHTQNQFLKEKLLSAQLCALQLADSEQTFKQKIAELLVDAGTYLGNPAPGGRGNALDRLLAWNQEGISKAISVGLLIGEEIEAKSGKANAANSA